MRDIQRRDHKPRTLNGIRDPRSLKIKIPVSTIEKYSPARVKMAIAINWSTLDLRGIRL